MSKSKVASSWISKAGILLLIVALVIMQSSNANAAPAGQSTWSTVTKVGIGGSTALTGAGLLLCAALNAGCPVAIGVAGGIMGVVGGTIALFPEPAAPTGPFPSGPNNWPDAPTPGDPCGMDCSGGNAGAGSGGGGGSAIPVGVPAPQLPVSGKFVLPGRGHSFATAAKSVMRSFDWRQSAFDSAHQALLDKQRSGLFVAPILRGPVQMPALPAHHPLVRPR